MKQSVTSGAALCGLFLLLAGVARAGDDEFILQPGVKTRFSNGGWSHDRYKELAPLDAGKRIVIADLKGPGIIREIYIGEHKPKELMSRGIVLEIWFDDAKEPAVMCPVADFFGDGCNGKAVFFSSKYVEYYPKCYIIYFPMPFAKSAKVILRNDTNRNANDYSFVEWESLPKWDPKMGYFHATYRRDVFQLTKTADHMFFEVKGSGHVMGHQFSMVTDEPLFGRGFHYVMEGNNEVDIDGQERVMDYLGTECAFHFGWGWPARFVGFRAGAPCHTLDPIIKEQYDKSKIAMLSNYRFHDHMPIRFNKSLRWHINWGMEWQWNNINPLAQFHAGASYHGNKWDEALARDGCWVDYAHVFYWYQDQPGGFEHQPLPTVEERMKPLLRSSMSKAQANPVLPRSESPATPANKDILPEDLGNNAKSK